MFRQKYWKYITLYKTLQKYNEYDAVATFADNLTEGLHKGKCIGFKSGLEFMMVKDSTLTFKYMECDKSYDKKLRIYDKKLTII